MDSDEEGGEEATPEEAGDEVVLHGLVVRRIDEPHHPTLRNAAVPWIRQRKRHLDTQQVHTCQILIESSQNSPPR